MAVGLAVGLASLMTDETHQRWTGKAPPTACTKVVPSCESWLVVPSATCVIVLIRHASEG